MLSARAFGSCSCSRDFCTRFAKTNPTATPTARKAKFFMYSLYYLGYRLNVAGSERLEGFLAEKIRVVVERELDESRPSVALLGQVSGVSIHGLTAEEGCGLRIHDEKRLSVTFPIQDEAVRDLLTYDGGGTVIVFGKQNDGIKFGKLPADYSLEESLTLASGIHASFKIESHSFGR